VPAPWLRAALPSQQCQFLDQCRRTSWAVAAPCNGQGRRRAFTSSAQQTWRGKETTIFSIITNLLTLSAWWSFGAWASTPAMAGQMERSNEITGGSPTGRHDDQGGDGSRFRAPPNEPRAAALSGPHRFAETAKAARVTCARDCADYRPNVIEHEPRGYIRPAPGARNVEPQPPAARRRCGHGEGPADETAAIVESRWPRAARPWSRRVEHVVSTCSEEEQSAGWDCTRRHVDEGISGARRPDRDRWTPCGLVAGVSRCRAPRLDDMACRSAYSK